VIYVENDRAAQQGELISLVAGMGYRLYWHTPGLFNVENFNGVRENVFGSVGSINMLCLPGEQPTRVALTQIDPANWTSPLRALP
jgi:hypothetical protein